MVSTFTGIGAIVVALDSDLRCGRCRHGSGTEAPSAVVVITQESIASLVAVYGPWLVFTIIALESAGLPLPGEATLIAAALLASNKQLDILTVVAAASAGAIVGDNLGYWVGRRFGRPLLQRYGHYIHVDADRLKLGEYLFRHYGGAVVFFGRFVAFLRALAALLAGVNRMPWGAFLVYNAAGGICWAALFGFGAYAFGTHVHILAGGAGVLFLAIAAVGGIVIWRLLRRYEAELLRRAKAEEPF